MPQIDLRDPHVVVAGAGQRAQHRALSFGASEAGEDGRVRHLARTVRPAADSRSSSRRAGGRLLSAQTWSTSAEPMAFARQLLADHPHDLVPLLAAA